MGSTPIYRYFVIMCGPIVLCVALIHSQIVPSFQKISSSLGKNLIIVTLESQPTLLRCPYLFVCFGCLTVWYYLRPVSTSSGSCIYKKLCLTCFIEGEKPERCLVH